MSDDHTTFYNDVYGQDAPSEKPYGCIQWKGTDVCMDVYCLCGQHGHLDCEFAYHYRCRACGAQYAVGQVVKLIPLTAQQVQYVEETGGFKEDERVKEGMTE